MRTFITALNFALGKFHHAQWTLYSCSGLAGERGASVYSNNNNNSALSPCFIEERRSCAASRLVFSQQLNDALSHRRHAHSGGSRGSAAWSEVCSAARLEGRTGAHHDGGRSLHRFNGAGDQAGAQRVYPDLGLELSTSSGMPNLLLTRSLPIPGQTCIFARSGAHRSPPSSRRCRAQPSLTRW